MRFRLVPKSSTLDDLELYVRIFSGILRYYEILGGNNG